MSTIKFTRGMTRAEAKKLATKIKTRYEKLPKDAGQGMESQTWDLALEVLLAWAREITADVEKSRSLLALSSFLVGGSKSREKLHRKAQEDPLLALKCEGCNADQDAYGSTCYEAVPDRTAADACDGCGKCKHCDLTHWDACGYCEEKCPDCLERKTWIRPSANERLTRGGMWKKAR